MRAHTAVRADEEAALVRTRARESVGVRAAGRRRPRGRRAQVRDQALGLETNQLAKSDVNREYQAEAMDQQAAQGIDFDSHYGKAKKNELLSKLQRSSPYYARNRSHICSFFVRGDCTRGTECPYRCVSVGFMSLCAHVCHTSPPQYNMGARG